LEGDLLFPVNAVGNSAPAAPRHSRFGSNVSGGSGLGKAFARSFGGSFFGWALLVFLQDREESTASLPRTGPLDSSLRSE